MIGPLSWIGGKNRLSSTIIPLLPEHVTYVEPFCGGAQVFFHKAPSKVEVLNDLDGELINFLRVCQWHYGELIRFLKCTVPSRQWFELYQKQDPSLLTDIHRAGRFFYLQKNAFGGLIVKQNYHYGVIQAPNYNPRRVPAVLRQTHDRLQGVQLESLPYGEVIERYDRPTTLFYLDPPYWRRKLYRHNMTDEGFAEMAERLRKIEGKFLLSIDDQPEIREIFKDFVIEPVSLAYSAQPKAGKRYAELLIANYPLTIKAAEAQTVPKILVST